MYRVRGKFTSFIVYDNLKQEPGIKQKLTNWVMHKEFDKINGKVRHSKAIEPEAVAQLQNICNQPLAKNTKVALMPDGHFGAGVPIGTTMKLLAPKDKLHVSPTIVSGDIGCGVVAIEIGLQGQRINYKKLDTVVENTIPSAFHDNIVPRDATFSKQIANQLDMPVSKQVKYDLLHSLGTLGSGNHFLELDRDSKGHYWLVIHSGSRHFGTDILNYYLKSVANDERHHEIDERRVRIANKMKKEGRQKEIQTTLEKLKKKHPIVQNQYRCLSGKYLKAYLHDMILGQKFAIKNRHIIANTVINKMGWKITDKFETIHNYFNPRDFTIRKGAVSAHKGERLIVPLNMRDGSLIMIGKGNPAWNYSSPHGAGRRLSRHIARKVLNMKQFKKDMQGIHSSSIDEFTLDEAPEAYKPMEQIIDNINPTAKIIDRIKPVYNYKDHQSYAKFEAFLKKIHNKRNDKNA